MILPKEIMKEGWFKEGEEVDVGLLKRNRLKIIEMAFGVAKGTGPFIREKTD